ncbi:MAG TPA: flagellar assembly protein FliW [Candidatus Hydrogenedentes bacterium]|nr:flagellar assembly protein FliW [Candidatus Hydrogenedentota bacterium]
MLLDTTRFGTLDIDPAQIITFTQPILGFQEYRRYILIPGPNEPLTWLQSTDAGDLAFILLDPRSIMPEYEVDLRPPELAELAVATPAELLVFTLVVVPHDPAQIRTNMRAPVLINEKHRLGKQTILERSNYPIQFYLAQARSKSGPEAPHARTHA